MYELFELQLVILSGTFFLKYDGTTSDNQSCSMADTFLKYGQAHNTYDTPKIAVTPND